MDEPNALMRWVMFHFAGGDALVVGLLAVCGISLVRERRISAWRWTLLTLLTIVWGGLSSPAWKEPMLVSFTSVVFGWRWLIHHREQRLALSQMVTWLVRASCLALVVLETAASWTIRTSEQPQRLCVIADSVTAGLNDGEHTWPQRFAEQTGIAVRDASQPGATLRSALNQAEFLADDRSPLLLEIGGNDLLSGLPLAEFTHDLDRLCQKVCTPGRTVWMCELPLPPYSSGYGASQRHLCRRYGIRLIPKRRLMQLLTTSGATVDGIHLSSRGQELFCQMMQRVLLLTASDDMVAGQYEKLEQPFPRLPN
jgi:acyl-CoA thioesterase-1